MGILEELLEDMDRYDWDSVETHKSQNQTDYSFHTERWQRILDEMNLKLQGLVLDVACGPVSVGVMHNNTVGYDVDPSCIKSVRHKGIKGIIGDYRKLPFENNTFDVSVAFNPNFTPFNPDTLEKEYHDPIKLANIVTSEMLRVTKKRVLIAGFGFANKYLPLKFQRSILKRVNSYVLYDTTFL